MQKHPNLSLAIVAIVLVYLFAMTLLTLPSVRRAAENARRNRDMMIEEVLRSDQESKQNENATVNQ